MRVKRIIWIPEFEEKLLLKHAILVEEVEEVLFGSPQIYFLEKGHREDENLYVAYGQTEAGRNENIMANENGSSISKSKTLEEMAEFWDTHSVADYEDQMYAVDMTFEPSARRTWVGVEPELLDNLRQIARARHISTQTLINLWLSQRVERLKTYKKKARRKKASTVLQ